MKANYVQEITNGHLYVIQLLPSSCDLDLATVQSNLHLTKESQTLPPSFSLQVSSKVQPNLYLVTLTFTSSVVLDTQLGLVLDNLKGVLFVPATLITSLELQKIADSAPLVGNALGGAQGVIAFSTTILGMSGFLWSSINFQQFVLYFKYLQISYPPQVDIFLSVFGYTSWTFLPNPLKPIIGRLSADINEIKGNPETSIIYQPPPKFVKDKIPTFFIETGTSILCLNIAALILIALFRLLRKCFALKRIRMLRFAYTSLRWNFILRLFLENGGPLALSTFLQFRKITFKNLYTSLSGALAMISVLYMCVMVQFIITILCKRSNKHLAKKKVMRIYGTLYGEVSLTSSGAKYYHLLIFFRTILITFLTAFLDSMPLIQVVPLIVYNSGLVYYLFTRKIFESFVANVISRLKEIIILSTEVCVFFLCFAYVEEKYFQIFGWMIVLNLCLATLIEVTYLIVTQIGGLIIMVKKMIIRCTWLYERTFKKSSADTRRSQNRASKTKKDKRKRKKDKERSGVHDSSLQTLKNRIDISFQ